MAELRSFLPAGSRVRFESGSEYEITGEPIGSGGGSLIYPADRVYETEQGPRRDGIGYALKECYPAAMEHRFVRGEDGGIVPETPGAEEEAYLERVRQMQLQERQTTQQIYRTGTRLLPILEASDRILLALPGRDFLPVRNAFTAMESLAGKGRSLSEYMKQYRRMSPAQTFYVVRQVLLALREIHGAGYLHLDIQAGNVFVKGALEDESGVAAMIDFGSARPLTDGRTDAVTDRVIFTTQGFSAPEMILHNDGTLRLGPEADIYSTGCLLLYLLTGERYDAAALLHNTTGRYLTRFKLRKIDCPKHLVERMQQIIGRALEPDPGDRYHTADEMLEDVSDFLKALEPYRGDLASVKYDAFICYKHGPTDSAAAKELQRLLERFRAPRGLARQRRPFHRVFVDEGELSSSADFGEQIRQALKNAGWLIVVCSPETPASPWVRSEIATFLEYHDRSRILAVLTGGSPGASFPELLRGNDAGAGETLAADARGKDRREVCRHLKGDALLKIAAPMLSTTFDALKQRRRLYVMQRAAALTAAGLLAVSAFAGYALVQNCRLDDQFRDTLINQSRYLAALAQERYDSDDPMGAIGLALNALPTAEQDRPVVAGAEYALTQALNVYKTPDRAAAKTIAAGVYCHKRDVADFFADFDAGVLFTRDRHNDVFLWDVDSCALLDTVTLDSNVRLFCRELLAGEERLLLLGDYGHLYCYDYGAMEMRWVRDAEGIAGARISGGAVIAVSQTGITGYDLLTGEEAYTVPLSLEDITVACDDMTLSPDGSLLAFDAHDDAGEIPADVGWLESQDIYVDETDDVVVTADLAEKTVRIMRPGLGLITAVRFTPEGKLLVVADRGFTAEIYSRGAKSEYERDNTLTAALYRPGAAAPLWSRTFPYGAIPAEAEAAFPEDGSLLLAWSNKVAQLSLAGGDILDQWELSDKVIWLRPDEDGRGYTAITRDGRIQSVIYGDKHWFSLDMCPPILDSAAVGGGHILTLSEAGSSRLSDTVVKYEFSGQGDSTVIAGGLDITFMPHFYADGGTAVFWEDSADSVYIYDAQRDRLDAVPFAFDPGCDITVRDILGLYDVDGRRTLLLSARDDCDEHSWHCLVCVDPETLEQRVIYVPLPEADGTPLDISAITYVGDMACFACRQISKDRLFVCSWRIGDPEAHTIAVCEGLLAAGDGYYTVENVAANDRGDSILLALSAWEGDVQTGKVAAVSKRNGTVRTILDGIPGGFYSLREHMHLNDDGTLFTYPADGAVEVYDMAGGLRCSIPYDPAAETVAGVAFVPGEDAVLVLTDTGALTKYPLDGGPAGLSLSLAGDDQTALLTNANWSFPGEGELVLSGYTAAWLINTDDETGGLLARVDSAVGYDDHTDRFYTFEGGTGGAELGYFHRYSTRELVDMGGRVLGDTGL